MLEDALKNDNTMSDNELCTDDEKGEESEED